MKRRSFPIDETTFARNKDIDVPLASKVRKRPLTTSKPKSKPRSDVLTRFLDASNHVTLRYVNEFSNDDARCDDGNIYYVFDSFMRFVRYVGSFQCDHSKGTYVIYVQLRANDENATPMLKCSTCEARLS